MSSSIRNLMLAALLAVPAAAQEPAPPKKPAPPAPGSLEATIEDAQKFNSDVQSAMLRVREAQGNLNKVRNEVIVQVTAQYRIVSVAREVVQSAEETFQLKQQLAKEGRLSRLEMIHSHTELSRARAMLAEAEAALMKLVGRVPGQPMAAEPYTVPLTNAVAGEYHMFLRTYFNREGLLMLRPTIESTSPPASMSQRLHAAMKKPLKIEKALNGTVPAVIQELASQGLKDIPTRVLIGPNQSGEAVPELAPGELPLSAWLQAVQDSVPELRIVVREYGLLVTTVDRLPPDALLLSEFLRRETAPAANPKTK